MQTQFHVLSNCEKWLNKYNWRYDSVLNSLLQQFSKIVKTSSKIYCDSNKYQYNTTLQLFMTQCPDNAVLDGHEMTVIELTICFQTNTLKSRECKIKRYKYIKSQLLQPLSKFKVLFAEITSLVFISSLTNHTPNAWNQLLQTVIMQYSYVWKPLFMHHTLYFV